MTPETLPRVLIVDDELPLMRALCDGLRETGFRATGVGTPEEALRRLGEESYEVLLSDLNLPGKDGITLLHEALARDPSMVAIIMTGQGTIDTAIGAMKSGAFDYILKPFRLSSIVPVIRRALAVRDLRLRNQELEHHIRLRSAELEAANRELEAFTRSVSHDLRAPMRGIVGYSDQILHGKDSTLSDLDRQLLHFIHGSARTMMQMMEGMLDLSRSAGAAVNKMPVDVQALVLELIAERQHYEPARSVEVRVGTLTACEADPVLLRQVFINLLSNAWKYTRQRERAVIEVGAEARDTEQVYFVRDNGAGFSMEQVGRLFGLFERLHGERDFEGTGVGLSIVQRIVMRHGGRVWADGEVGRGATFYFSLPNGKSADAVADTSASQRLKTL